MVYMPNHRLAMANGAYGPLGSTDDVVVDRAMQTVESRTQT
jgi:hypothetical protein